MAVPSAAVQPHVADIRDEMVVPNRRADHAAVAEILQRAARRIRHPFALPLFVGRSAEEQWCIDGERHRHC